MREIFERRSIRKFKNIPVTEQQLELLLRAGMAAPSAGNGREWSFLVIKSAEGKNKFMEIHDASFALKTAPLLIMVCARTKDEAYPPEGWWIQDCSAAIENLLIEAVHLGLGTLWMGIYPREARINKLREAFDIPEDVVPVGGIAVGVPYKEKEPIDRYMQEFVFEEKYGVLKNTDNSEEDRKALIGIKYCGGCQIRYDRKKALETIKQNCKENAVFESVKEGVLYDLVLILNGCQSQCAQNSGFHSVNGYTSIYQMTDPMTVALQINNIAEKRLLK